jgi:hypothetical protein
MAQVPALFRKMRKRMAHGRSFLLPDQKNCDAGYFAAVAARHKIAAYFF